MYIENTLDGRELVVDMTDSEDINYVIDKLVERIIEQGYLRKVETVEFKEWESEEHRSLYPAKLFITPVTIDVDDYLPLLETALQEELANNRVSLSNDNSDAIASKMVKQLQILEAIMYLQLNFD